MTYRLVQSGPGPVTICYLVGGQLDPELRAALPGRPIVATAQPRGDLSTALRLANAETCALVGYSMGCSGVRDHLVQGVTPAAVVTIDGTHANLPPAAWQMEVWRELQGEASRGERLWATTCVLQRYVERLKSPHVPYTATSTLLAKALELPELLALKPSTKPLEDYPGPVLLERHAGDFHLEAYGSTDCDHDAHAAQQSAVLPSALRRYLAPFLDAHHPLGGKVAPPAPPSSGGHALRPPIRLTEVERRTLLPDAIVDLARLEAETTREEGGHNAGPVAKYFKGALRDTKGTPLDLSDDSPTGWAAGWDWCAAACTWVLAVAAGSLDLGSPLPQVIAVWEIVAAAKARGLLEDASTSPRPGWLAIYGRSGGDPRKPGQTGHVTIVDADTSAEWSPNTGTAWAHRKIGPDVLCWVRTC